MIPISHDIPEIYKEIQEHFPNADWNKGLFIAYEGKLHCHPLITPTPDEMAHEETHIRQQEKITCTVWWDKYFREPRFRLEQEIEAYKVQADYMRSHTMLYSRQERRDRIRKLAKLMSGPLYGNLISYDTALEYLK